MDILVNNAGAAWGAAFDEFPEEGWDKVLNLNAKTPFFLTQAMAPALRKAATAARPAKVINIASIDGIYLTHRETYSYVTSKAGLIQLTRLMAARLVKDHIHVTAIAPGAFKSDMNREARDRGDEVAKHIPARRIGTDEDMAGAAIFLASRAGDYVIGSTVTVDGGVAFATPAMRDLADGIELLIAMATVSTHYETHLGPVYSWMLGDLEAAFARSAAEIDALPLPPRPRRGG